LELPRAGGPGGGSMEKRWMGEVLGRESLKGGKTLELRKQGKGVNGGVSFLSFRGGTDFLSGGVIKKVWKKMRGENLQLRWGTPSRLRRSSKKDGQNARGLGGT